jgi:hypothetical protein
MSCRTLNAFQAIHDLVAARSIRNWYIKQEMRRKCLTGKYELNYSFCRVYLGDEAPLVAERLMASTAYQVALRFQAWRKGLSSGEPSTLNPMPAALR